MASDNPEIQALIDEYGEDTVRAAFNIARSIGENGIPGIDFSGAAEDAMRQRHYPVTKREVEQEAQRELDKLG